MHRLIRELLRKYPRNATFRRYSNFYQKAKQNHHSSRNSKNSQSSSSDYQKFFKITSFPLALAAFQKNNEASEKSIENSSIQELNERSLYGWTILHECVAKNDYQMVKKLLELGVDPDTTDNFTSSKTTANRLGRTESEIFNLRKSSFPITEDLEPGAILYGSTALHYSVLNDNSEMTELLLSYGANPVAENRYGDVPEQYINIYSRTCEKMENLFEKAKIEYENRQKERIERKSKLYPYEVRLHENIVGQDSAVAQCAGALRRKENGWLDEDHPLVMLFLGSSGIGKTELAKQIVKTSVEVDNFIRFDMSEFQQKHEVSKFIGAPPGYVGYDQGGALTEALKEKPDSIVLLDEVEKAHPDVLTVLLQLFDEGRITDGQGETIHVPNAIFIMTSNLGSELIAEHALMLRKYNTERKQALDGQATKTSAKTSTKIPKNPVETSKNVENLIFNENITEKPAPLKISESGLNDATNIQITRTFREKTIKPILKKAFRRDEFIGRINEIIYFLPFDEVEIKELTIRQLNAWSERADLRHGISMSWASSVVTVLADAYDVSYGARSIQHEVDRRIVNKLAEAFETGLLKKGDHVHFEVGSELGMGEIAEKFGGDLSNVPIRLVVNGATI
jgi:ATP-dependent Clp protease ATP-binding subunit ClpB